MYIQLVRWYFFGISEPYYRGLCAAPPCPQCTPNTAPVDYGRKNSGALTDMGIVRMSVNAFGFFADDLQELYGAKIVFFFLAILGVQRDGGAHIDPYSTSAPKKVFYVFKDRSRRPEKERTHLFPPHTRTAPSYHYVTQRNCDFDHQNVKKNKATCLLLGPGSHLPMYGKTCLCFKHPWY